MLQYKNHRLHCEGVSFQIPDGFFINTQMCPTNEDAAWFASPDKPMDLEVQVRTGFEGAQKELVRRYADETFLGKPCAITPVVLENGLSGYQTYSSDEEYLCTQTYEVWLDLSEDLALSLYMAANCAIQEIDVAALIKEMDIQYISPSSES